MQLKLPVQGRDGDCNQAAGAPGVQLETAAIAPRCPAAGSLDAACGRCYQRVKRGAEAGREAGPKASWPVSHPTSNLCLPGLGSVSSKPGKGTVPFLLLANAQASDSSLSLVREYLPQTATRSC